MRIQTTFIVKFLTEETIAQISEMSPRDAFSKLAEWARGDLRHCVSQKDGNGSFGDRVRVNGILRDKPDSLKNFRIEPRKGYRLITFEMKA